MSWRDRAEEMWERSKRLHSWLKREHPEVLEDLSKDRACGFLAQYSDDSPFGRALAEWTDLGEPS